MVANFANDLISLAHVHSVFKTTADRSLASLTISSTESRSSDITIRGGAIVKTTLIGFCLILVVASSAFALDLTNVVTNQGGGAGKPCDTTGNLPSSTYSQVSSDNAGQPCVTSGSPASCDPTSTWNYEVHGHVTFGPPSSGTTATKVEVQTYIGGNHIACTAGTTVTCTGSVTLVEDSTHTVGPNNEQVSFNALEALLAAYNSVPGDLYRTWTFNLDSSDIGHHGIHG